RSGARFVWCVGVERSAQVSAASEQMAETPRQVIAHQWSLLSPPRGTSQLPHGLHQAQWTERVWLVPSTYGRVGASHRNLSATNLSPREVTATERHTEPEFAGST